MTAYGSIRGLFVLALALAGHPVRGGDVPAATLPEAPSVPAGAKALNTFKLPANASIMIIPINDTESTRYGMIDNWQAGFVTRRLQSAKADGYAAVVLEIDTNGGSVAACERINKEIAHAGVPVIAFVRGKAFSGGALISLGSATIVMEPGTQIGGAQAVSLFGDLDKDEREKARSMLVAMVKGLCERNGHPETLAHAMVDSDVEILETDRPAPRFMTGDELADWKKNEAARGPAPAVKATFKESGQILTLTSGEAIDVGLASQIVADRDALMQALGVAPSNAVLAGVTSSEKVSRFLGHPGWLALLVLVALGGLIYELKTPGIGLGLGLFLFCMGLFFWLAFFADTTGLVEISIFLLGAVLIGVEIFVLPGFGVAGIAGGMLVLFSIVLAFIPQGTSMSELWEQSDADPFKAELIYEGLKWASMTLLAAGLCIATALVAGVRLPGVNRLALAREVALRPGGGVSVSAGPPQPEPLVSGMTTIAGPKPMSAKPPPSARPAAELIGKEALAETVLRPSGKVRLEGVTYEAMAEGDWVDAGAKVKVLSVGPYGLVVRPV
ncbi:MAG: hypothetical protein AMXMBFR7_24950 [Planctomycetota bacterium]